MTTIDRLIAALGRTYRVDRELGAGGMATVYLAHDLRHDRDVAIKVLHPELGAALGGERFLAEIRTTARLQHPNILALLDSGEADGLLYYVMPLVEGETLRGRLERERQLPLDAAIRIATEVADALGYAHRQGVIHRDIKPENILLHDGRPIVADFGIALAVTAASGSRMTQTGLSLGTPQYMAPEQAMGDKHIDARADVYAIGAVTYEMLTGEPPFTGATVQAIVAKVLTERPTQPTAVRDTIPRHVEATVLKALAKLPADRFTTASDFAHGLQHPAATASLAAAEPATTGAARSAPGLRGSRALPWAVAALATAAAGWGWFGRTSAPSVSEPTLLAQVPGVVISPAATTAGFRPFVLSADGTHLAWLGNNASGGTQIFLGALAGGRSRPVPGTEGSFVFVLSPDAKSVAFSRRGELWVVGVEAGQPRRLGAWNGLTGLVWVSDGSMVLARGGEVTRVPAAGGDPKVIFRSGGDTVYTAPRVLEESGTLLLARSVGGSSAELVATSLGGGPVTPLGITAPRMAYARGVLVYVAGDGTLLGVPFDPVRRQVMGDARPIGDGAISTAPNRFDLSRSGILAFVAESSFAHVLTLVDRTGRGRVVSDPGAYLFPRLAPSGSRLAVGTLTNAASTRDGDLWTIDLATGVKLRVTTDGASTRPSWAPDGQSLVFSRRSAGGRQTLARMNADGTTPATPLLERPVSVFESGLTADGRMLVWREDNSVTGRDIFTAPVDTPAAARPVLQTRFDERGIAMGPEGDWIAYVSNESGRDEVYVRRLAAGSPRWPVSRNGGVEPRWTRSGEVFFRKGDSVFVSRVGLGTEPRIAEPTLVFTGHYQLLGLELTWDAAPDGKSFVMVSTPEGQAGVMVYANWIDRWRAAAPQPR